MRPVIAYAIALAVFVAIDLVWLGFIAKDFYRSQLGTLMTARIKLVPAAVFYLIYPIGILMFAVLSGSEANSIRHAALFGGAFGLLAYATYDLSNAATLEGWPMGLTYVDIAWGTVLTSVTAAIASWAMSKI